jgi:hypothetical protein
VILWRVSAGNAVRSDKVSGRRAGGRRPRRLRRSGTIHRGDSDNLGGLDVRASTVAPRTPLLAGRSPSA